MCRTALSGGTARMLLRCGGPYALRVGEFSASVTLQCAHTTRFLPGILRLENWVKSGLLGDIRHIISMRAIPPRRRSWIDDAILHHAAHHIDLLLHWFGDVTPVASVAHPRIEGAQDAALVATTPESGSREPQRKLYIPTPGNAAHGRWKRPHRYN